MPVVSVIIPNYNHAQYLKQRIDSVLHQTFEDFEVIILDDCSTDSSREVIEMYRGHPKVSRIEYNTLNSGSAFKQWKKGIDLAKGKYIWIAESDDYASPNFLLRTIEMSETHPDVSLIFTASNQVDEKGNMIFMLDQWIGEVSGNRWSADYVVKGKDEIIESLSIRNTIPNASSVLVRKDQLPQHIDKIQKFKYTGDWFLWLNLLNNDDAKVGFIADRLNNFRQHGGTTRQGNYNAIFLEEWYTCLLYPIRCGIINLGNKLSSKDIISFWGANNGEFAWKSFSIKNLRLAFEYYPIHLKSIIKFLITGVFRSLVS